MLEQLRGLLNRATKAVFYPNAAREAVFQEVLAKPVSPNIQPATQKEEIPMSIFSAIANAEHTFAAWAEKELTKLIGEAPTFLQIADTTLTYAGPILQTVLASAGQSAAATEVGTIVNQSLSDITVVRAVIQDAGPVPSAKAILQSTQTNLSGLLTAGHISNPASVALVNKLLAEFAALLAAFPAPAVAA